ncbi:M16 family metallopeptidase [Dyadobacter chenhuakuii]|uniref:Insulinase family protein n=1 Tax=Dyadobacter chenhuakuii TaxID=2909339 RepID=A0ABY4XK91_9BACT|nr:pitrilysin family protein [Dyadobacter chenhuakuii]MCF2493521.1 insulinase family protein [Dyadobacter chenhuakuii]USJ30661.1 insulinase family protein [Dyadobacter chenhuakuii]
MKRDNVQKQGNPKSTTLPITEDYHLHTLANGIRIAHKRVPYTQIAHCGIMLDIGSRDELPHQQGLAHFWEHMAFKGTEKRSSYHIINRLENVGGELNAYTTKEKICFHASVLDDHFDKAMDLLADITFHSVFPEKQIERERNVILEEMSMYIDSPEDAIQDDFDQLIFPDHALGNNILGTAETVGSFGKADLMQFINDNIDTERIVVSSVSRLPFSKVIRVAEKYLGNIPHRKTSRIRQAPLEYVPVSQQKERSISQAQCAMGQPAYPLLDDRRLSFFMLVNLLGGPGMNSRFNLSLREKYGFVYSIEGNYTPYLDTGFMGIFFGTEQKQLTKSISLIHKELKKIREVPLSVLQLHQTKVQLMGQLAMSEESNMSFMLMMAKSLLDTGRVDSLPEIFTEIEQITALQLQDIAQEMFKEENFSYLTFLPED